MNTVLFEIETLPDIQGRGLAALWDGSGFGWPVLHYDLLYLRYALISGELTRQDYGTRCDQLAQLLRDQPQPHREHFLNAWQGVQPIK